MSTNYGLVNASGLSEPRDEAGPAEPFCVDDPNVLPDHLTAYTMPGGARMPKIRKRSAIHRRDPSASLFEEPEDAVADAERAGERPLADRMRPRTLDEFVGQEKLVGPGQRCEK